MNIKNALAEDLKQKPMENWERPAYGPAGINKREYFAGLVLQGLVNREGWAERFNNERSDDSLMNTLAIASVKMADELLKQLEIAK